MSNMLKQAIADAAALREQAIKNAEQSVIEKYSQQIKEAVDQMLEVDASSNLDRAKSTIKEIEDELINEEESTPSPAQAMPSDTPVLEPAPAWDSRYDDMMTNFTALVDNLPEDENGMVDLDLGDLEIGEDEKNASEGSVDEPTSDLGDLGEEAPDEEGGDSLDGLLDDSGDDFDLNLQEVMNLLEQDDEEVIEEEVEIDYNPILDTLGGNGVGSQHRKDHNAEMAAIVYPEDEESSEEASEDETTADQAQIELYETLEFLTKQNSQMESVLSKMEVYLEETLLSNAKLLYQNRTLGDASLNERQKSKIVEAIANAESPKEAKKLHETLKATVGSTPNSKRDPQSLSESVNRRSNLSSMLNSRQNINESKQSSDPFLEKMQKLAGIKK
jgi:hypothetical protein